MRQWLTGLAPSSNGTRLIKGREIDPLSSASFFSFFLSPRIRIYSNLRMLESGRRSGLGAGLAPLRPGGRPGWPLLLLLLPWLAGQVCIKAAPAATPRRGAELGNRG